MNSVNKLTVLLIALIGVAMPGCGKKEAQSTMQTNAFAPDGTPRAVPREYVVNGQIDLDALTQTLRDYVRLKGKIPADMNELVTSGYLTSLPKLPPGKRFVIKHYGFGYGVVIE